MALSDAQKLTLKSHIESNSTELPFGGGTAAINTVFAAETLDAGDAALIAGHYNTLTSPAYYLWRSKVPVGEIFDQITWVNYTPADAVPTDTELNAEIWQGRSLACQGKQFNLQTMLIAGNGFLDAVKPGIRAGLNDATTALPSGTNGASRSGGWTGILAILKRVARNVEKVFGSAATGTGNNGANPRGDTTNPDAPGFEGTVSGDDISDIHGLA